MTAVAPESVAVQPAGAVEDPAAAVAEEDLVLADLLVEEISIDGMCGVY
jgi:mycofactocin precursor